MDLLEFFDFAGAFSRADAAAPEARHGITAGLRHKYAEARVDADGSSMSMGHVTVTWARDGGTTVRVGTVTFVRPYREAEWSADVEVTTRGGLHDVASYTNDFRVLTGRVPRLASLVLRGRKSVAHDEARRRIGLVMNVQ